MLRLSIGSPSRAPEEEEEEEEIRPIRQSYTRKERLVHLIPVLTLLCVLVLYLSSHDPSKSNPALVAVAVISEMGRYEGEAEVAIVNHRALKANTNTKLGIRKLGSVN